MILKNLKFRLSNIITNAATKYNEKNFCAKHLARCGMQVSQEQKFNTSLCTDVVNTDVVYLPVNYVFPKRVTLVENLFLTGQN